MNGNLDDYLVSMLMFVLAVVVALGKGDFLISGYNTASEEKKAKYNVQRLRLLVSSLVALVAAGITVAAILGWDEARRDSLAVPFVLLVVVYVVLSCTWAKKKE